MLQSRPKGGDLRWRSERMSQIEGIRNNYSRWRKELLPYLTWDLHNLEFLSKSFSVPSKGTTLDRSQRIRERICLDWRGSHSKKYYNIDFKIFGDIIQSNDGYTWWAPGNPVKGLDCVYAQQTNGFNTGWLVFFSLTIVLPMNLSQARSEVWKINKYIFTNISGSQLLVKITHILWITPVNFGPSMLETLAFNESYNNKLC